jgi:hypothetical protein
MIFRAFKMKKICRAKKMIFRAKKSFFRAKNIYSPVFDRKPSRDLIVSLAGI